ncbi:hypothetical protein M9979_09105 [Sphingomonas sp. RP10(2022)]|uniref:Uncharacterized protein n=1 Tax=Sphingomonas liriopis TaxID=2949094 RepID=A0A9X2KQI7_9SPHN|nr:hypothetical protein [Sphingomonas liriopis]MCP3735025.1 hypothetical protein [Sphingomonas liriopis]
MEIEREVLAEWDSARRPLLISRLGMRLTPDTKAVLNESGLGLKRYIQRHLGGSVRLVPMKGRGGGAAPVDRTVGIADDELETSYDDRTDAGSHRIDVPQFWGDIWRGFQTALAEGDVRYVVFNAAGNPEVRDVRHDTPPPAGAWPIEPDDLALAPSGEPRPSRAAVYHAIQNWCRRTGVAVERLTFDRAAPAPAGRLDPSGEPSRRPATRSGDRPSFMQGIDLLSRDELARISIPADLVLAMLERSGAR